MPNLNTAGVAMARGSQVGDRITAILDSRIARRPASRSARLAIVFIGLALILTLAACSGSAVHRVGEKGIIPPSLQRKVEPKYTDQAKTDKIQGTVLLSLQVDAKGHAQKIKVDRSLRPDLDQKAIEAVQQWTFKPGEKSGKPVTVSAKIEINFKLL